MQISMIKSIIMHENILSYKIMIMKNKLFGVLSNKFHPKCLFIF